MQSQPAPGLRWRPVSGDAVAGLLEAREVLEVQVEQLTGMLPLVAPDRRDRFEGVEPVKPRPAQDSADGGGRDPHGPRSLDRRGSAAASPSLRSHLVEVGRIFTAMADDVRPSKPFRSSQKS